jgi:hypothetical protein
MSVACLITGFVAISEATFGVMCAEIPMIRVDVLLDQEFGQK